MQIPVIKKLSETYSLAQLKEAEEAILNESIPTIEIEGKDEGEQLTHVLASIDILTDMEKNGVDARTALRNYTQRVRNSIS
ncbi:MAG: hypothetical protein KA841_03840 [Chitinophagales bacterium]|jgi:hypothetical protein|nr:hypothetical protein [Chitinophagales bacterium]